MRFIQISATIFLFTTISFAQIPAKNKQFSDALKTMQDSTDFLFFEGKYDKVVLTSFDNIKFAEKIGDTAAAYYSKYLLAATFMTLEDYENAKEYADGYLEFATKSKDTFKIARAFNLMGGLYLSEKKYEEALPFFMKALPLSQKLKDTLETSIIYYNISESYISNGKTALSQDYFLKAKAGIEALKFTGLTTEMNLLEGKLNLKYNRPNLAIENFETAINFAKKGNYIDDNLVEVYDEYSNALYASGKPTEAYKTHKIFDSLNKIQFERHRDRAIQNAAAQFSANEYKEKARQIKLEKQLIEEKAKRSKVLLYVVIGTAIAMGVFIFMILRSNQRRKKLLQNLREKNRLYLDAKEKSEQLALAKSKFFSTVSHELRTPLYGVIGLSSVLLEDPALKNHQKDLNNLKFSADYLLALINDVLQISKLESKTLEDPHITFNFKEFIKSITSSFEYVLLQNRNKLTVSVAEEIPTMLIGNRMRLSQIIMNLLGNASKFTQNGDIFFTATVKKRADDSVTINFEIRDTGIGIPEDKQKTIFEEFQQIEPHQYKLQGTGLGLPIVKKLLEASNGSIFLKSKEGEGSCFTFRLEFKTLLEQNDKHNLVQDTEIIQGKSILVVDDNRINQIVTKKILENQGAIIEIAENGNVAIEKLKKGNFDLALMDINMPGKSGIETTKEIRKFNTVLPIIALTAVEIEEMQANILASGMNDIVIKPYDVDSFLLLIARNLVAKKDMKN